MMQFNILFIIEIIAVSLLIAHSFLTKGARVTLGFFLGSFLWAFRKEHALAFSPVSPYQFNSGAIPRNIIELAVVFGWVFDFYVSWCLAEAILEKTKYLKKNLFMTLFLGMWITVAISYGVESTAIAIGWWKWNTNDFRFLNFFFQKFPLDAVWGWADFFIYFMSAYLIIECSRIKTKAWRFIFLLLPIIYIFFYVSRLFWEIRVFVIEIMVILAFLNPLELSYKRNTPFGGYLPERSINNTHFLAAFLMLGLLGWIDIFVIKDPRLLFSLIPFVLFILAGMSRVKEDMLSVSAIGALSIGKKMALPASAAAAIILLLKMYDWVKQKGTQSLKVKALAFIPALLYMAITYAVMDTSSFFKAPENTVTITGTVIADNYKSGAIKVGAWAAPIGRQLTPDITHTRLPGPGKFSLKIPKRYKEVYIRAVNVPLGPRLFRKRMWPSLPAGDYPGNPVSLEAENIPDIIIRIK